MKRRVAVIPMRDCIANPCGKYGCGTDPGSSHGVHNEEWLFVVGSDAGDFALVLAMGSGVFPRSEPQPPSAYDLTSHVGWPTTRDQVRENTPRGPCDFVVGGCYTYSTTGLGACEFADKHFVPEAKTKQPETFWAALEERAVEIEKKAMVERTDTEWQRCVHCDATGTVRR